MLKFLIGSAPGLSLDESETGLTGLPQILFIEDVVGGQSSSQLIVIFREMRLQSEIFLAFVKFEILRPLLGMEVG